MEIDEVLTRGVSQILPSKEGLKNLMKSQKITLYQGFDPSAKSLHLGNYVGLLKLRQFQKLGHKVIFLVGDFTGLIGDPDKISTRVQLTPDEVKENYKNWKAQVGRLLDLEGDNKAEVRFNSEWNNNLNFEQIIDIASKLTVQQLIERDMFQERLSKNAPIYLHEFLYPLIQGYDSVVMDVDLEIGGNDQIFNMLAGRTLMRTMKGKEKYVLATKLLVDNQGNKAGKTTGNALFLDSLPEVFYGGIMSFSDELILPSFELLTELPLDGLEENINEDPLREKKKLALEVVKIIWGEEAAKRAENHFAKTFQEKEPDFQEQLELKENLMLTIAQHPHVGSNSKAKRLIKDGAVDVNGINIKEPNSKLEKDDKIKIGSKIFAKTV